MVFIELPIFIRCAADLFSDQDLAEIQNVLLKNPAAGDLIPGGRGLRKLRVALPGRGKRDGARIIYYQWVSKRTVLSGLCLREECRRQPHPRPVAASGGIDESGDSG